jgi:DNA mismatch repair protein MutL
VPAVIQRLPDHIANQIAAGEVIQRPASAVKELLENAVDSGATEIRLIIKDAGKELVQVIDNGCGMNEADARLCFARHATSKIREMDDLFHIRTMGFRGEALASIAAVAQVVLKTRTPDEELGIRLEMENGQPIAAEPCACPVGTSLAMKNLFFNFPARRHFLRSNTTEMRHIVEEFLRVVLAFPAITFVLEANGQEVFHLPAGGLKSRVLQVLGNAYKDRLVTVAENTDYLNMKGFVGKPDAAKKTRGDQYLFVNNRFIRSGYLHHALMGAFEGLIPPETHPMYVLFLELDPERVDVNVHPTKQEIKFEDEKLIYAFVQSAVKHALARFSITPTLDFNLDASIEQLPALSQPFTEQVRQQTAATDIFKTFTQKNQAHTLGSGPAVRGSGASPQEAFLLPEFPSPERVDGGSVSVDGEIWREESPPQRPPQQIHARYILQQIKSGFILVDQQAAHERILYERYREASRNNPLPAQQSLFPQQIRLSPADAVLFEDMLGELTALGYEIKKAGNHTFQVHGLPGDLEAGDEQSHIEALLEQWKHFSPELHLDKREQMIRTLAARQAVKPGKVLSAAEMQQLIDQLFACQQAQRTPGGQATYLVFRLEELADLFSR